MSRKGALPLLETIDVDSRVFLLLQSHNRKGKAMTRSSVMIDETVYGRLSGTELSKAREKEAELSEQDYKVEQAKEKKNTLESYVYETRNKVELLISLSFLVPKMFTFWIGHHLSFFPYTYRSSACDSPCWSNSAFWLFDFASSICYYISYI